MAGTDELRLGDAVTAHSFTPEGEALIPSKNRTAKPNRSVTVADGLRNMCDLVPAVLGAARSPPEPGESLEEE